MTEFAPALPHAPIRELFPDVFVVRGSITLGPLVSIARNMIIVREGRDLTLVNSVRLSDEGERELEKLGRVKHLVKVGLYHTRDDAWVRHRFDPTYWAPVPKDDKTEKLVDGGAGPLAKARVFSFEAAKEGEAALIVEQEAGNLLVTCDSVQNWTDTEGCSFVGGLVTRMMGFIEPAKIGPIWLKNMTQGQPTKMKPDFERLLSLDFRHLIAGHGTLLRDEAKEALRASVERTLR